MLQTLVVRARVIQVTDEEPRHWRTALLRIEHVYAGDASMMGRTFEISSSLSRFGSGALGSSGFDPPLEVNQIVIDVLRKHYTFKHWWPQLDLSDDDQNQVGMNSLFFNNTQVDLEGARNLPDGIEDAYRTLPYTEVESWAEAVEAAYHADFAKRIDLLKEDCCSANPRTAAWAIHVLSWVLPDKSPAFLRGLIAGGCLTLAGQITADEVLSRLEGKKWIKSAKRFDLMCGWMQAPFLQKRNPGQEINESFEWIWSRLVRKVWPRHDVRPARLVGVDLMRLKDDPGWEPQGGDLEPDIEPLDFIRLVVIGCTNLPVDDNSVRDWLQNRALQRRSWRVKGIPFLLRSIRGGESQKACLAATRVLSMFCPLSKEEGAQVKLLAAAVQDQSVRDLLKKIMQAKSNREFDDQRLPAAPEKPKAPPRDDPSIIIACAIAAWISCMVFLAARRRGLKKGA